MIIIFLITRLKLSNFRSHFEVLNDLLETIINDKDVSAENKTFFKQLLKESKNREKNLKKNITNL